MFGSYQAIFMNPLGMKRAAAQIVPKLLNFKQKQRCMDIAQEMLTTFNDDADLFKKVRTGNESTQSTFNFIFYTKFNTVSLNHFFEYEQ